MIPRYSHPQMVAIWESANRYNIWLDIEIFACEALEKQGVIPAGVAKAVRERAVINPARVDEIEETTKHDVIAFLSHLAESVGEEARFVHQGMTSSDVVDTAFSKQLTQAADLLLADLDALLIVLKERALASKDLVCMGRSHGIHAEPTTFGLKFASFYAEFKRNRARLVAARAEIAVCAVSGAVGTYAHVHPNVQKHVAERLGLASEPISTQVIPRDRHAQFFATLGVIASSVERVAIEIRHLQRTEVLEAEEYFAKGQKGSSAMPHKRNPILSENITGLARLVRGYVVPALENVALWHERDISHSSVERMIGPDATVTLDFALRRLTNILENLVLYPENIKRNLEQLQGLIFSQRVLLALTQNGLSREDAYQVVQTLAMRVWREQVPFLDLLQADPMVSKHLSPTQLEELFDYGYHTKHVGHIFAEVFA